MRFQTIYGLALVIFLAYVCSSSSGGRNGNFASAPGDNGYCANCHTTTPGIGSIVLNGVPSNYTAGMTYPLSLVLTNGTANVGGFQIVATNGSNNTPIGIFSTPAGTRINNVNRLVQNTPKAFSSGSVTWDFNWTAPATNSTGEIQFYYAGNAANGNGNRGGDMAYRDNSGAISLPIELAYFEVERVHERVNINWETLTESNNDYFEIERSNDGSHSFKSITVIDAVGNSSSPEIYNFTDTNPNTAYYRLKQVDEDGSFSYSKVKFVKSLESKKDYKLYPNPLQLGRTLSIDLFNEKNSSDIFSVTNSLGQLVYQEELELIEGNNILQINLPDLPVGYYFTEMDGNVNKLIITE